MGYLVLSFAEDDLIMRKTLNTLFALLLAIFAFSSVGEAAPKHNVRHRPRHSTRVTTGSSAKRKKVMKARRQAHRASAPSRRKATTKPK
jgi:hypothetical protein